MRITENFIPNLGEKAMMNSMAEESGFDPERLCDNILEINQEIQSVSIVNHRGRAITRKDRANYSETISKPKNEMFFMQRALEIAMGQDFDDEFGPIEYNFSVRRNCGIISFPMKSHVILVTTSTNQSPISLAQEISARIGPDSRATK